MVMSHSKKGFKSAEEVQAFLTRNAGISKEKVVLEMLRRFKLGYDVKENLDIITLTIMNIYQMKYIALGIQLEMNLLLLQIL